MNKSQVIWTENEINLLKECGNEKLSHELLEILPRHTALAISTKRRRLGINISNECKSRIGLLARSSVNNDNLCKLDQNISFDDIDNITKQILIGSILGDGSIKKNSSGGINRNKNNIRNFIFYEYHGKKQIDYLDWKMSKLHFFLPSCSKHKYRCKDGKEMWTVSHPIFTMLRKRFYPDLINTNKHIIPVDIAEQMNELALLIWYFDDGYIGVRRDGFDATGYHRRPAPSISAKGWNYEDLCKTAEILNKNLGLHLYIKTAKHRDGINKIVKIPAQDRDKLFPLWQQLAKQYDIPECMMYKLDLHERKEILDGKI